MRNEKGQFVKGHSASPNTQFKPGSKPWNKNKHGYMGSNVTSFKPGNIPPQQKPKGTITRQVRKRKNGQVEIAYSINIDWKGNRKPHNNYKWYLWEVANSEDRPPNSVLYIKNGSPNDLRVENFEVITRAELMRRNHGI